MSKNKKNLLIIQSRIQHYRVPFFDHLKKKLKNDYNLLVTGGGRNNTSSGNIKRSYFYGIKFIKLGIIHLWIGLFPIIRKFNPDIIITTASPRNISILILYLYCKILNIRIIGWSKIYSDNSINKISFLKIKFYQLFDEIITYGYSSKKLLLENNYKKKIHVAFNTIDTDIVSDKYKKIKLDKIKKFIKKKYQLKNKKIFLFIGRMYDEKNPFDIFFLKDILKKEKNYVVLFIGSGPIENILKEKIKEIDSNNFYYIGKVPYLYDYAWISLSDVVIIPGQVGLAMKQAMLLKTICLIADEKGPDTEALVDGITGYRYTKNNKISMIKKVHKILNKPKNSQTIINNAFDKIKKNHNLVSMVNTFCKIL